MTDSPHFSIAYDLERYSADLDASNFNSDSQGKALRLTSDRVERIEQVIIGARHHLHGPLCQPCLLELVNKTKKSVTCVEKEIDQYERASTEPSCFVGSLQSRSIDTYLKGATMEQLLTAVYDMEQEVLFARKEESLSLENFSNIYARSNVLSAEISEMEKLRADHKFHADANATHSINIARLLDSSARELNYMKNSESNQYSHIFQVIGLFDTPQIEYGEYGVINGHRLCYRAIPQLNLNWAEINSSWANLEKLVRCVRNKYDLPQCIDLSILSGKHAQNIFLGIDVSRKVGNEISPGIYHHVEDTPPAPSRYVLRLRPLRDRAIVLVEEAPNSFSITSGPDGISDKPGNRTARAEINGEEGGGVDVKCAEKQRVLYVEGGVEAMCAQEGYQMSVLIICVVAVTTLMEVHIVSQLLQQQQQQQQQQQLLMLRLLLRTLRGNV